MAQATCRPAPTQFSERAAPELPLNALHPPPGLVGGGCLGEPDLLT